MNDLTVVVVYYDRLSELQDCLRSIETTYVDVIVIDVSPSSGADALQQDFPDVSFVAAPENKGYGWACNLGVHKAATEYVVVSNSDVIFQPGALEILRNTSKGSLCLTSPMQLQKLDTVPNIDTLLPLPGLRASLSRWLYLGRRSQTSRRVAALGDMANSTEPFDVTHRFSLSGACVAMSLQAHRELGGFDEGFFLYEEDVDLSLRGASEGIALLLSTDAHVIHSSGTNDRGLSRASLLTAMRSERRLWSKHGLGNVVLLVVIQTLGLTLRMLASFASGHTDRASIYRSVLKESQA